MSIDRMFGPALRFVAVSPSTLSAPTGKKQSCTCPRCGNQYLTRLARMGFLENKILPLFGYYPWICGACRKRKYFRVRGKRILRKPSPE
jgi:hypothetical protein